MRSLSRLLSVLALSACSCGADPGPSSTTPVSGSAPYEVHEWGLLRQGAGDVLDVGAIAPRTVMMPMAVDKPVLYFHATAPVHLARIGVEAIGGTIREHQPRTAVAGFPASIEWRDLDLDPAAVCGPPIAPSAEIGCPGLDPGERCESLELARAAASDSTCVGASSFLFYRSRTSTFMPPLRLEWLPTGEVRATNAGSLAIPGSIVRLERSGTFVRTLAVRPPGPGETITIANSFPADSHSPSPTDRGGSPTDVLRADDIPMTGNAEPGRRAIEETMRELGLSDPEIHAFLVSWDPILFGGGDGEPASDQSGRFPADMRTIDGVPVPEQSILYFLPAAACDGVSRLSFDPPPTAVHRALAIWSGSR